MNFLTTSYELLFFYATRKGLSMSGMSVSLIVVRRRNLDFLRSSCGFNAPIRGSLGSVPSNRLYRLY